MANKSLLAQMLERLVNEDQAKAEELFHEYVVEASREIYESLIESEIHEEDEDESMEESSEEDDEEEDLEESSEEDEEEDDLDENFEDVAVEGGEEGEFGGDQTGDLGGDLGMGDEEGEDLSGESEEELFQDLDAIVDELQARFDALGAGEEGGEEEMGGEEEGDMEGMDPQLATVREYVEKVPAGHGAEKKGGAEGQLSGTGSQSDKPSVNTKSTIDNMKNDMGGTTANILSSKEDAPVFAGAAGGKLKGTPLSDQTAKDMNTGNINVPGGNAGKTSFKKKEPGHGAEKKGGGEGVLSGTGNHSDKPSVNHQSLFRGRR